VTGTTRFVVVPASYLYLLRERPSGTEVLLQLRGTVDYLPGHWAAAAAGHVERGETASDAVLREAREELGLITAEVAFEFSMHRTAHDLPIDERIDFFFTARSWTGEPRIMEADKCAGLGWFPLEELPEPMVPHERHALASLGTGARHLSFGF